MEVHSGFLAVSLLLSFFVAATRGSYFSQLKDTLTVTATHPQGQVLKAGDDQITVTWRFNQTYPAGTDSDYKTVKVKLCYAPISQKDRKWRKTEDHLKKDRTCQHKIVARPYAASNNTFTYTIKKDIPTGVYFVRAYALDAQDVEVAYGQTTDAHKTTNLFEIQAITGRHKSLDITSVCFSAFSVVSLAGFFYMEKRKAKVSQQK
ncbi:high-affinity nitrate transporter 3.1-like [Bidens hawaiensis]|uniref:high-affinity nitrate transporter 3.1-like n=1 Tax=Bidens hawaiensis TaxID=980011 RepID=UPI00404989FD